MIHDIPLAHPHTIPISNAAYNAITFEAMQLVDNVRNYYDILSRMETREAPPLPPPEEPAASQLSTKGTTPGK